MKNNFDKTKLLRRLAKLSISIRYWVFGIVLLAIQAFVVQDNYKDRIEYRSQIHALSNEIKEYKAKVTECEMRMEELRSNNESLIKFAREKYYMKRHNEEIFIIKE